MEEKNIVAIDLGTSKIAITVANVNGNDVQVTYYKERPSTGIRYSSVYNIMHATEPLARIINEAEEELDIITLEFDDGVEVECEIMGVFDYEGKEYIALIPDDGSDDVYIYGYKEVGDDEFELVDIEDDAEFEKVVAEFDKIMAEEA